MRSRERRLRILGPEEQRETRSGLVRVLFIFWTDYTTVVRKP